MSMKLCDEDHTPIVHDEKHCPLCEAIGEANEAHEAVDELREEVNTLQEEKEEHVCEPEKKV